MAIVSSNGFIRLMLINVLCLLFLLMTACQNRSDSTTNAEPVNPIFNVRLGSTNTPLSWLTHIAEHQGFYKQQGLNVTTTYFKSGKQALKAMFQNEVDIATTAIGPVVSSSLTRKDFSILATIGTSNNDNLIVARKDKGIQTPGDLSGKIVATQSASASHFYLHLFLLKQKLSEADIIQSFMKVEELPQALASGKVDAISTREPYYSQAMEKLGDIAVVFETPGLYLKSFELVAGNTYIKNNPEILQRLLKALLQAEQFVKNNRVEAIKIITTTFKIDNEHVTSTFKYLDLSIALDQSLILKLEDEARWVIKNRNDDKNKDIQNYLNFINASTLINVNSARVTVVQ